MYTVSDSSSIFGINLWCSDGQCNDGCTVDSHE